MAGCGGGGGLAAWQPAARGSAREYAQDQGPGSARGSPRPRPRPAAARGSPGDGASREGASQARRPPQLGTLLRSPGPPGGEGGKYPIPPAAGGEKQYPIHFRGKAGTDFRKQPITHTRGPSHNTACGGGTKTIHSGGKTKRRRLPESTQYLRSNTACGGGKRQ